MVSSSDFMSGQKTRTEKLKQKNGNLHLQLCQDNKRHLGGFDDDDDDALILVYNSFRQK